MTMRPVELRRTILSPLRSTTRTPNSGRMGARVVERPRRQAKIRNGIFIGRLSVSTVPVSRSGVKAAVDDTGPRQRDNDGRQVPWPDVVDMASYRPGVTRSHGRNLEHPAGEISMTIPWESNVKATGTLTVYDGLKSGRWVHSSRARCSCSTGFGFR